MVCIGIRDSRNARLRRKRIVGDPDKAAFDTGHDAHEIIHCMEGDFRPKWGDPAAPEEVFLTQGSGFHIAPGVPHTLTTARGSGPGKVISVNL
ncbi:hypothetical protein DFJ69_5511 [Thermomonospora umbrina]|uniref:Uncharacterized protein n=2 Tax=Thermomonospora umbrina TaxID=111806 RepID=A0A3D9SZJ5_9ACTN|nr:hypothetical protein DFJ69_5511 [Thermomonospora umbrina]